MKTLRREPGSAAGRTGKAVRRKGLGRRLLLRAQIEARRLMPAWLFFFLSFSLLRLTQTAVLQEFGVSVMPQSRVLAGSILVAKAIITVDSLRMLAALENRPVLTAALCKTLLYGV